MMMYTNWMKQGVVLGFVGLWAIACTPEKVAKLTPAQQQAKLDSILAKQQQLIKEQESEYRRDRLSIEVKEKADSILAAEQRMSQTNNPKPNTNSQDTVQMKTPSMAVDTAQSL